MNKFDPKEIFINNFGRRLKSKGTKVDTDPLLKHCALLDNCFCSNNTDCGKTQICTTLPGYKYRVCKTRNEVPLVFNRGSLPSPLDLMDFLMTDVPTLALALLGHCTVDVLLNVITNATGNVLGILSSGLSKAIGGLFGGLGRIIGLG